MIVIDKDHSARKFIILWICFAVVDSAHISSVPHSRNPKVHKDKISVVERLLYKTTSEAPSSTLLFKTESQDTTTQPDGERSLIQEDIKYKNQTGSTPSPDLISEYKTENTTSQPTEELAFLEIDSVDENITENTLSIPNFGNETENYTTLFDVEDTFLEEKDIYENISDNATFNTLNYENEAENSTLQSHEEQAVLKEETAYEIIPRDTTSTLLYNNINPQSQNNQTNLKEESMHKFNSTTNLIQYHFNSSYIANDSNSSYVNFTIEEELERPKICRGLSLSCGKRCCSGDSFFDGEEGYCKNKSIYDGIPWKLMTWGQANNPDALLYKLGVKHLNDAVNEHLCLTINASKRTEYHDDGNRLKFIKFVVNYHCTESTNDSVDDFDSVLACFKSQTLRYLHYQAICLFPLKVIGTISTFFLLILGIMFLMSPKKSLQVKCMTAFCITVFARDLPIITIIPSHISKESIFSNNDVCHVTAVIRQMLSLSASIWTTILCTDKSWVIRQSLRFRKVSESKYRFLLYCLVAWGLPVLIGLTTLILMYLPETMSGPLKPVVHSSFCGLQWWTLPTYVFYDGPLVVILLFNAVIMSRTTKLLYQHRMMCVCFNKVKVPPMVLRSNSNSNHVMEFKHRLLITFLLHVLWVFKLAFHLSRSDIFIIARVALRWVRNFRGFIIFLIVAKLNDWAVVTDSYKRVCAAMKEIGKKISLKVCPADRETKLSDNIIEQTRF